MPKGPKSEVNFIPGKQKPPAGGMAQSMHYNFLSGISGADQPDPRMNPIKEEEDTRYSLSKVIGEENACSKIVDENPPIEKTSQQMLESMFDSCGESIYCNKEGSLQDFEFFF